MKPIPFGNTAFSEQPDRLLGQLSTHSLEISTVEKHSSGCERIRQVFAPVASRIEDSASVIVAQARRRTCATEQE